MASAIFISYSSPDKIAAEKICSFLEASGHSCFMAHRDVPGGHAWAELLLQKIQRASVMVLVFSRNANESEHVPRELILAISYGVPIIPYRIEDVPPDRSLEYLLCPTHWLDDFHPLTQLSSQRLLYAIQRFKTQLRLADELKQQGPLTAERQQQVLLMLGQEMLRQRQSSIAVTGWTDEQLQSLGPLLRAGVLRENASAQQLNERFVGFVDEIECLAALADAIRGSHPRSPLDWLAEAERFPLVADALGVWLARRQGSKPDALTDEFCRQNHPLVGRVLCSFLTQFELPAVIERLQSVIAGCTPQAIRGCIQAAQTAHAAPNRLDWAEAVLERLHCFLSGCNGDSEYVRLAAELANERGRIFRREGRLSVAVAEARRAVKLASQTSDERLHGICITNLCRAILDQRNAGESIDEQEVVNLLKENISRFKRLQDGRNCAVAWNNLGDALQKWDAAGAEKCFRRDVQLTKKLHDWTGVVDGLNRLGVFLADTDRLVEALKIHRLEAAQFKRLFDFQRQARCEACLGRVYLSLAHRERQRSDLIKAIRYLEKSRQSYGKMNRPFQLGAVLENLGKAFLMRHDLDRGRQMLVNSIAEYRRWPTAAADADRLQREFDAFDAEMAGGAS